MQPQEPSTSKNNFECATCGRKDFKSAAGAKNHARLVHGDKTTKANPLKTIKDKAINKDKRLSATLPVDTMLVCLTCGLHCSSTVGLKLHKMSCKVSNK